MDSSDIVFQNILKHKFPRELYLCWNLHSSMGKAILAELSEPEQQRYLNGELVTFTENTITSREKLKQHLIKIKKEGVAFDFEEYTVGVRGVAVPLKNSRGDLLGAIGMIGPSARLSIAHLKEWIPLLNNCVAEISRQLDYKGVRKA